MRHGKKFNHLGRKSAHRKALLKNLAKSIILNKRLRTTLAKAKALKKFVEPLITKSKTDTTHSRRVVFSYFQDKEPVKELFNIISSKVSDRPGGYTRIIKLSERRSGDNSEMCIIELVDFNELTIKKSVTKTKTRRSRSKSSIKTTKDTTKVSSENIATDESNNKEIFNSEDKVEPKTDKKDSTINTSTKEEKKERIDKKVIDNSTKESKSNDDKLDSKNEDLKSNDTKESKEENKATD